MKNKTILADRLAMILDWYKEFIAYMDNNKKDYCGFIEFEENGRPSFIITELVSNVLKTHLKTLANLPVSTKLHERLNVGKPTQTKGGELSPLGYWFHALALDLAFRFKDYATNGMKKETAIINSKMIEQTLKRLENLA